MSDWKEIVKNNDRYENFVIVDEPKPFNKMFTDQDISYVQTHSTTVVDENTLVGCFSGVFEWKDNKIISLDGDSYSENMIVFGYEWFENEGKKCLDILV
jgi:hypothetical protein